MDAIFQAAACGVLVWTLCWATYANGQATAPDERPAVVLTDRGRPVHASCIAIAGHNHVPYHVR